MATVTGVTLALALCAGSSTATVLFDHENTGAVRRSFLPADRSWIDHSRVGDVTLLRNIGGVRGAAFQQLFWNRTVKHLMLMPGAPPIDSFPSPRVRVADDGALLAGGVALRGALLVDGHAVTTRLTGVRRVASGPGFTLYAPAGRPRLSLFFLSRYDDGWLGERGTIDLWPRVGTDRLEGKLVLDLEAPAPLGPATVDFRLPDGRDLHARVPGGGRTTVTLPVCSHGPWAAGFRSKITGFVGDRAVSIKGGVPSFVPGSGGCKAAPQSAPAAPSGIV